MTAAMTTRTIATFSTRLGTPPSTATLSSSVVVVPTYNEAGNVEAIIEAILGSGAPTDVLVVDDSSPDGTADIVRRVARRRPGRVHLLVRTGKEGLGAAYRAGLAWALEHRYEVIVQMDADGSHPASRLPLMIEAVLQGRADVVIGSRYVPGGTMPGWPLRRRLLSAAANAYARTLLDLHQRDATCGYRAWRREALMVVDPGATRLQGYGFLVELSAGTRRSGLSLLEVPITFVDRLHGCSKLDRRSAFEGAAAVWRLRRRRGRPAGSVRAAPAW
jgi:dolichol-phosphate mannosyltransferase